MKTILSARVFLFTIQLLFSFAVTAQNIVLVDNPDVAVFPSGKLQGTVTMSLNRYNPNIMVVAADTRYNGYNNVGRYVTRDGGQTWTGTDKLDQNIGELEWDVSTAIGANGNIFVGTNNWNTGKYYLTKSTDNGVGFSGLMTAYQNPLVTDNPRIAIDDQTLILFPNNIYVVYGQSRGDGSGGEDVLFRRSSDNGQTFSAPVKIGESYESRYDIQTGANGEIYVSWPNIGAVSGFLFCRSTDGGRTFSSINVGNYQKMPPDENPMMNEIETPNITSIAVDKSGRAHHGRIYVAVPSRENGVDAEIKMTYSDDQGTTWSPVTKISDAASRQCWRPKICVDQVTGNVFLGYSSIISERYTYTTVTKLGVSSDGGNNFVFQQASDIAYETKPMFKNSASPIYARYAGEYIGLAAHDNKAYLTWTDDRRDEKWQIHFSRVDVKPRITGPTTLCSSAGYSVDFPCRGSVTWTVVPDDIVSLSCTNCPSPTITKVRDGIVTLSATVGSTCGASPVTSSLSVIVGNPFVAYPYPMGPDPSCLQKGGQILYGVNASPYRYGTYVWGYVEGGSTGPINYVDNGGFDNAGIRIPNNEQYNGIYVAVQNECGLGVQSIAVFEYSVCGQNDVTFGTNNQEPKSVQEKQAREPEIHERVVLSPNPVRSKLNVSIGGGFAENTDLQIFNAQGVRVYRSYMSQANLSIDVSALPKGVYVLQLTNSQKKRQVRFVKI